MPTALSLTNFWWQFALLRHAATFTDLDQLDLGAEPETPGVPWPDPLMIFDMREIRTGLMVDEFLFEGSMAASPTHSRVELQNE